MPPAAAGGSYLRSQIAEAAAKATPRALEPLRAGPDGFPVHLLNRSDKVSCEANSIKTFTRVARIYCNCFCSAAPVFELSGRTWLLGSLSDRPAFLRAFKKHFVVIFLVRDV